MMGMHATKQSGFTLIELMIVVAVVAILAAIAYPSYQNSVRKGRRAEAKSELVNIAQSMERCFTQNNSYLGCTRIHNNANLVDPFNVVPQSGDRKGQDYNVTFVAAPTRTTFSVIATAVNDQLKDGCGNMTINQAGSKTSSGSGTNCWN